MLFTPSLAVSPPPSTSLLPSLNAVESAAQFQNSLHPNSQHHAQQQHARRARHTPNPRSTLALLAADERATAQRKLAIAMYGYAWLRPAGCTKTMLGRREEEVEREEVERQLREVEMQERAAMEAEEQERLARLQEEGETTGERDLDDDVPEAADDDDEGEGEGDNDGMDADLDDEIPDADPGTDSSDAIGEVSAVAGEGWAYDTNREQDSDDDHHHDHDEAVARNQMANVPRLVQRRGPASHSDVDERAAHELADELLDDDDDDDEMGEMDLDEYDDADADADVDLDADVPDADEGGWEHTDSELEDDSAMDMSILPGQAPDRRSSGARRSSARVISGNVAANATLVGSVASQQRLVHFHTPQIDSARSASASASTRRSWLDAARAGRNLFGLHNNERTRPSAGSGLFTPSPAAPPAEADAGGRRRRADRDSPD